MYSVNDTLQAGWVFPFGDPRIKARLSAPRGISQISTSFIAYYRLGIHRMRLFTWPYNPKQPFWLDLFPPLCVAVFAPLVTYGMYAPGGRKSCALIDEKISAPVFRLQNWFRFDLPTPFVRNVGSKPNNKQTSFVADTTSMGSWLKERHFRNIKSPKVICRAVHDATLNNTTRELKNSVVLLYFFITDSNC